MQDRVKLFSPVPLGLLVTVCVASGIGLLYFSSEVSGVGRWVMPIMAVFWTPLMVFTLSWIPYRLDFDRSTGRLYRVCLLGRKVVAEGAPARSISVRKVQRRSGKNGSKTVHPVQIVFERGRFEAGAPRNYLAARRLSEGLARMLEVNIQDSAMEDEKPHERDYRCLDRRFYQSADEGELGPAPGRLQILSPLPGLAVRLPRRPAHGFLAIVTVIVLVATGFAVAPFALEKLVGSSFGAGFLPVKVGGLAIGLIILGILVRYGPAQLPNCYGETVVRASAGKLEVDYSVFGHRWTRKLEPERIEEIRPNRQRLVLLGDAAVQEIESPMTPEEGDWVVRALKRAVRG